MLKRVAAAGLSLILPACKPAETPGHSREPEPNFGDGALRLDWRHKLARGADDFTLERLRFEGRWPGGSAADGPDWGDYRLSLYAADREAPLFRQGFDTGLAPEAASATTRFSVRFPMPRHPVRAAIEKRRADGTFHPVASVAIDPAGAEIDRSPGMLATRVDTILAGGEPGGKVDIALLGDGYRDDEYPKFVADAARAAGYLFSIEPFRRRTRDFNVSSVFTPSAESGVTDAYLALRRDTVFRCAYGSGGSERTLTDGDNHAVREAAAAVAYDFLLILANARRYGGSAYFNGPAVVAIDSAAARYLAIHEFAHAMAGLADEYYIPAAGGPAVAGNVEPWHPNVTNFPDRDKWRDLAPEAGPAPWKKAEYDAYFAGYVRRYEALRARGAAEAVVEEFMGRERARQAALLAKNGRERRVGYFEGANGYAKGAFRAEVDCIMFSLQADYFCAACSAAIERMIDYHSRQGRRA